MRRRYQARVPRKQHVWMTQGVADKGSYVSSFHAAVTTCLSHTASAQPSPEEGATDGGHGEEEPQGRAQTSNLCEVVQVGGLSRLAVAAAEVCHQAWLLSCASRPGMLRG